MRPRRVVQTTAVSGRSAAEPSSVLRLPLDGGTERISGLEFWELHGGS